ncbi:MAG: SIR2 family protein [bacterium]
MPTLPRPLIEAVRRKSCVAFVGAGLSIPAGAPSWKEFLKKLIDEGELDGMIENGNELRKHLDNGSYLEISEFVRKSLGSHLSNQYLRRIFAISLKPTENHKILVDIPFRGIITTNYDKILETAYTMLWSRPPRILTWEDPASMGTVLYDKDFFVFKLHGDIDRFESIIMTSRDYDNVMFRNPHIRTFLHAIFLTSTLLFIGYSMNDPDFQMLMTELPLLFEGATPMSYALLPDVPEILRKNYKDRMNITVLPYDAHDNHKEVTKILQELRNKARNESLQRA